MTGGLLPAGFQSPDFPPSLFDIEFCATNLRVMPDDLDLKWPRQGGIQFEYCHLTSFSSVFLRLEPKFLVLTGNPMTEVPADVFEIPGLRTLGLGQLNLNELPRNVMNPAASLIAIFLDGTNISYFWPWMDDSVTMEKCGILIAPLTSECSRLAPVDNSRVVQLNTMQTMELADGSWYL
ncbi:hypothetical protein L916_00334 [Phytophthora nicotianae]|uniref:Leucine-rich repeat-containing N-terminal plant-type domain-containing protein n=1 Tax=Phytophthora nicotianae TaxID=4792 RepID=W2JXA4_PHYNI|nr:hypothetical protein L916_00334 [Phytophthora nicotianae]